MPNLTFRPFANGAYTQWTGWDGAAPSPDLWEQINERDLDATDFVYTDEPGAFTVGLATATYPAPPTLAPTLAGSWPRPTRIVGVRAVAALRTAGTLSRVRFRLRHLGADYDSEVIEVTNTGWVEFSKTYDMIPNGHSWTVPRLNHLEGGLVFVDGDRVECGKLEYFIFHETYPHVTLQPDGPGFHADWAAEPTTAPPWMAVAGVYDGDISYLHSATVNEEHTFEQGAPALPLPFPIDRVQVKALVKNVGTVEEVAGTLLRSGAADYRGGTNSLGRSIPPDDVWHLLSEEYLNDPQTGWPSGVPSATPWTPAELDAIEIGVENAGGGDFRCTAIATETWLKKTPATVIDLYPSADSAFYQDLYVASETPPQAYPNLYQNIDEDPPDDAASFLQLDAIGAGTPQYYAATVSDTGGMGPVPPGEQIYNVEVRCRIRLASLPHSEALVAPLARFGADSYVGRPQRIEGTATIWFDTKWDFVTNPYTGLPWVDQAEVEAIEWGFAVIEGDVFLSRERVRIETVLDVRSSALSPPDPISLELTDAAATPVTGFIDRSRGDGTIYWIDEFSIGSGGFDTADPRLILPVNTADTALMAETWRGPVRPVPFDGEGPDWWVDYYCHVPRDAPLVAVGELGLWAYIYWSPNPAEIGTRVLFALQHFPCRVRHSRCQDLYVVRISY